jgi:hypothetical protein
MIPNSVVVAATLLGGAAAVWFFRDKIAAWLRPNALIDPSHEQIEKVVLRSDPRKDWLHAHGHTSQITSYRHNPTLRFERSFLEDGVQNDNYRDPWANRHPDSHAVGYWCDLYFGPTLIRRFVLVAVDGARALIPPPRRTDGVPGGDTIQPLDLQVARIHDTLSTLDEYIARSGLRTHGHAV